MVPMMWYVILVCQSFGYDFNQMVTVFATIFFLVPPMFAFRAQFLGRHSSVFETSRRKLQQTDPKEERLYRETIRWSDAGNRFGDGKPSMITQRSKSSSADLDWSSCLWRRFRVEDLCRRALLNHVMLNHSFFSYLLSMFIHFHPQFLLWYFFSSFPNHALVNFTMAGEKSLVLVRNFGKGRGVNLRTGGDYKCPINPLMSQSLRVEAYIAGSVVVPLSTPTFLLELRCWSKKKAQLRCYQ